jgi:predicted transglutaminase-like cysteine proteinase
VSSLISSDARPKGRSRPVGASDLSSLELLFEAGTGAGDCEDIQLLKRRLLTEFGLPRRAMRMTVVLDEIRAGHAVLMVRTDRGDFILDNKTNAVLPWSDTPYDYHKREGADGLEWVALSHQHAPVVTAAKGATSLPVP